MEELIFGILRYIITSLYQRCPDPPLVRACVLRANKKIPLGNANIIITRLLSGALFKFTIVWKLLICIGGGRHERTPHSEQLLGVQGNVFQPQTIPHH